MITEGGDGTTATDDGSSEVLGPRRFEPGQLVSGRFRVVREIAQGGMAVVYEVRDEKLDERRALKCAKPGYARHLPPEARHSLRVTHPNVCRVFEIHSTETPHGPIDFLTMEYLDGGTLANELRVRGALPPLEARDVAVQICAGVEAAHAQGLLHRDLKTNNVLLTEDKQHRRRAVVTDFGLAQEPSADQGTDRGRVAGTPAYLAPERRRGVPASQASDIFALGVVLHELVSGRKPDADERGNKVLAPGLPRRWRQVIERCLDPDPDHRYRSVADVRQALTNATARRRAIVWTGAALIPLTVVVWQASLPATLAARLAILPLEAVNADAQTTALVQSASSDLSVRLTRLRPRPPRLVVIPVQEARSQGATDVDGVREKLGASHVLLGTMTRRADRLFVRSSIVDTTTKIPLREVSADYAASDIGAVAAALSAMVAEVFRLPRQTAAETVAPAAYPAYAEGNVWLQKGPASYARAIAAFEQAIALDPQSVLPRAGLAEACYRAWEATADASWLSRGRDVLAKAEALNADSVAVRLAAGRLSLVPGAFDRAALEYRRATEIDPTSAEAWAGLARAYMEMQDRDGDAAAAFMKAVEVQPGYYGPLVSFGDFWRRRGNYVEAEKHWRQVIALAPKLQLGHINLGGLYGDMGRYDEAERELRRALEIEPTRAVLNNLGSLYQYMGRDEEAIRFLERARAAGPETHILLLNLGDSYRRLGRARDAQAAYRRAREIAEAILRSNPRDAAARAFVAYFALRLGDRPMAERELAQALSLGGETRTVVRRAAISYEALGERERALAVLESAPPDVLRELSRQPDLTGLRADPRFLRLLPRDNP